MCLCGPSPAREVLEVLQAGLRALVEQLYLLFNEGYAASAGADLVRQNLTAEAIRLARILAQLMPDEPEAGGLLALLLLHDARRAARTNAAGELVPLEDQDRSRWDASEIKEGAKLLEAALRRGRPGPCQVQAAIAACHSTAPEAGQPTRHKRSPPHFPTHGTAPSKARNTTWPGASSPPC